MSIHVLDYKSRKSFSLCPILSIKISWTLSKIFHWFISRKWVHAVNELVECWSQLEGKIDELTKWVEASKSSDPGAQAGLSIDKLEEQLNLLKVNFKDKQGLVDVMSNACKGKMGNRRKSQVNQFDFWWKIVTLVVM